MAGSSLGTAYVQVIPKFKDGSVASMGKEVASGIESGLGDALKNAAAVFASSAIVKGIYDIGKAAVDAYADYEQLVGGVETLFGAGGQSLEEYAESVGMTAEAARDSYDDLMAAQEEVLANAQNAYKTAGLSANEYMETVTSFSASLIASLGGDTAKAAEMADMAITDMSDNANKMGTDMEAIQNAYNGFAKQNYTMLDNLKLGYGGTAEEMKRLLADAEAISGVHYDIENYSDVVSAIHVIQDEMGITGTTAREAASTISGSWGMLEGSWKNLLVSIAGGGDDINVAVQNVFDSLFTWLGNIGPRIYEVIKGAFEAIPAALITAIGKLKDVANGYIRNIFGDKAADAALGFIDKLTDGIKAFGTFASNIASTVGPAIKYIVTYASELISVVAGKLPDAFSAITPIVQNVVKMFATRLCGVLRQLAVLAEPVISVFIGVANVLSSLREVVGDVITVLYDSFLTAFEQIDFGTFGEDFESFGDVIASVIESMKEPLSYLASGLGTMLGQAVASLGPVFQAFGSWLVEVAVPAVQYFATAVGSVLGPILRDLGDWFTNVAGPVVAQFGSWLVDTAVPAVIEFATAIADTLGPVFTAIGSWIADTAIPAIQDFVSAASTKFNEIKTTVKNVFDSIGKFMEDPIGNAIKAIGDGINNIKKWFTDLISSIKMPHLSVTGSLNPIDWFSQGLPTVSIEWYAKGGFFEDATLIGVGEKGTELAWPSYEPYLSKYAEAIGKYMPAGGAGTVNNIYLDGTLLGTDARIDERVVGLLEDLRRLGACNVG